MNEMVLTIIIAVTVIVAIATMILMRGRQPGDGPGAAPGSAHSQSLFGGVIIGAVCLILVILLSSAYTTYVVQQSQRQWCAALDLLTSHPVPKPADPAANPSRQQAYVLYTDFVSLGERFGCG